MSVTALSTIANQCFSVDPEGMTHEVSEFGARPGQDFEATPKVAPALEADTLDM